MLNLLTTKDFMFVCNMLISILFRQPILFKNVRSPLKTRTPWLS